jgi:hypothetical protein
MTTGRINQVTTSLAGGGHPLPCWYCGAKMPRFPQHRCFITFWYYVLLENTGCNSAIGRSTVVADETTRHNFHRSGFLIPLPCNFLVTLIQSIAVYKCKLGTRITHFGEDYHPSACLEAQAPDEDGSPMV